MANVVIPYHFPKGTYRAKVITRYKDQNNVNQVIESEPYRFDSNAKEYFSFKTNPQIQIDVDTMEAPNTELIDEGSYKGLNYKIYDNGLAIVNGEQTEVIESASEEVPWFSENITYIYGTGIFCSGFIFFNSHCIELELGECSFSTSVISRFIGGTSYQYIGGIDNIDITGLTNVSYFFTFTTELVDQYEIQNFLNAISNRIHDGTITNIDSIIGFSISTVDPNTEFLLSLDIDSDNIESSLNIIRGNIPRGRISIYSKHIYENMFNYSIGNMLSVQIDSDEYFLNQLSYCKAKRLFIKCPIPQSVTVFPTLYGVTNLEELVFDFTETSTVMDLSGITDYSYAFRYCSALKRVYAVQQIGSKYVKCDTCFDMTNVTNISNMFNGCTYLEESGIGTDMGDYRKIVFDKLSGMCSNFLNGCVNLHEEWDVEFTNVGRKSIYFSGIKNSGLKSLTISIAGATDTAEFNLSDISSPSSLNLNDLEHFSLTVKSENSYPFINMIKVFQNNTSLKSIHIFTNEFPNDDHKAGKLNVDNMCNGCTSVEEVGIHGSSFASSANVFKDCTALKFLELDDIYAALPSYGAFGQIQGYNIYLNSNSLAGCTALEVLYAPLNMYNDTYAVTGKYGATLVLPKTMYYNGNAYTVVRDGDRQYEAA